MKSSRITDHPLHKAKIPIYLGEIGCFLFFEQAYQVTSNSSGTLHHTEYQNAVKAIAGLNFVTETAVIPAEAVVATEISDS